MTVVSVTPTSNPSVTFDTTLRAIDLTDSGVDAVEGALVSSTRTSAFEPLAGRPFYLELTGTGSATVTVLYRCNDGSTYAPSAVATDGGSPIILDKIAYSGAIQNGVRMALEVDQAGVSVKASPGAVTGTVNFAFV